MSENQKKILQMLADGKISVDEAQRLLSLVSPGSEAKNEPGDTPGTTKSTPRYLYVVVEPKPGATAENMGSNWHGKVNVRVPFALIRAGMKLTTLIPPEAADKVNAAMKDKGFSFDMARLKDTDIEELISALRDSEVNVDRDSETVRVYAE